MVTKRAPTTQHCHAEEVQWNTYNNPYLPMQEWKEYEQKPADISSCELTMIRKGQQSKAGKDETCNDL